MPLSRRQQIAQNFLFMLLVAALLALSIKALHAQEPECEEDDKTCFVVVERCRILEPYSWLWYFLGCNEVTMNAAGSPLLDEVVTVQQGDGYYLTEIRRTYQDGTVREFQLVTRTLGRR